jgi:hypothetical protein
LEVRAGIEKARMATSSAGSVRAPMVITRLAPIPPSGVPVSRAPRAMNTDPRSRTKTTAKKSELFPSGGRVVTRGDMTATTSALATRTTGGAAKTQLA